jgi:hypothetical protein
MYNDRLDHIKSPWIRRPITIFLSLTFGMMFVILFGIIVGVLEMAAEWYDNFWLPCWRGPKGNKN